MEGFFSRPRWGKEAKNTIVLAPTSNEASGRFFFSPFSTPQGAKKWSSGGWLEVPHFNLSCRQIQRPLRPHPPGNQSKMKESIIYERLRTVHSGSILTLMMISSKITSQDLLTDDGMWQRKQRQWHYRHRHFLRYGVFFPKQKPRKWRLDFPTVSAVACFSSWK